MKHWKHWQIADLGGDSPAKVQGRSHGPHHVKLTSFLSSPLVKKAQKDGQEVGYRWL
jgi:hypothetical protein